MPTEIGALMLARALEQPGSAKVPAVLVVVDGGAVQVVKSHAVSDAIAVEVLQRAIEGLNARAAKPMGADE